MQNSQKLVDFIENLQCIYRAIRKSAMVAPIRKTRHHCTPCHIKSKYISEVLLYSNVFGRYEEFLKVVENDDYCAHLWHFNRIFFLA